MPMPVFFLHGPFSLLHFCALSVDPSLGGGASATFLFLFPHFPECLLYNIIFYLKTEVRGVCKDTVKELIRLECSMFL